MTLADRTACQAGVLPAVALLVAWGAGPPAAQAQFGRLGLGGPAGSQFDLSGTVELDRADSTVRTTLDRVGEYLAEQQWDEAVETILRVTEQSGGKLLDVTAKLPGVANRRFVSVRDYCHLQLASLPAEALAVYRSRVDPSARQWYEQGIARRDQQLLETVVDKAFASTWGDNALLALGEMALESGDPAAARACWEKIVPVVPPAGELPTWLCVPETDIDLAAVRARLVLASILEGSLDRARGELSEMERLHPDARGRLGGHEVNYVEELGRLLSEAAGWPDPPLDPDWPTFAGSPLRNKAAPPLSDVAEVAWRVPLRPSVPAGVPAWGAGTPPRRVAEDARAPLSYHPVVVGHRVLVNSGAEILALDLRTGKPAWGNAGPEIYRDQFEEPVRALYNPPGSLGVPRFTMTALGGKLYARMGSPVTSRPRQPELPRGAGYLVALDLEAEGRMIWKIAPPDDTLAMEGSPVCDGTSVYVAMRKSDIQPQAHVACFDAGTGRLRWRQFVCAAETPARGMFYETTHTLLTLHRDTIYVNTNLGAVAALAAGDGRVKWVSLYPRALRGDLLKPAAHLGRDLNPCLYDRGTLLVAPADSRRIFALDAATGQILWQTDPGVTDAVHLLGVVHDTLIASGDRLYWINTDPKTDRPGKVKHVWPLGSERLGYGRGLLAGDCVLWPAREKIYVFDQHSGQQKKVIDLVERGVTGGNLLAVPGYLLIATSDELVALREAGSPAKEPQQKEERIVQR